jgi:hypothetical protein
MADKPPILDYPSKPPPPERFRISPWWIVGIILFFVTGCLCWGWLKNWDLE